MTSRIAVQAAIMVAAALQAASCARPNGGTASGAISEVSKDDWIGVYASSSEIRGFERTVLVLEKGIDGVGYRMRSYSDAGSNNGIGQEVQRGECLMMGRTLFLPEVYGFMRDGKPYLRASITQYTLMEIKGRKVLMLDGARRLFQEENKLYDYGILIKVDQSPDMVVDLIEVEHPSIKVLYSDPNKPWNDPFVHGPNTR